MDQRRMRRWILDALAAKPNLGLQPAQGTEIIITRTCTHLSLIRFRAADLDDSVRPECLKFLSFDADSGEYLGGVLAQHRWRP